MADAADWAAVKVRLLSPHQRFFRISRTSSRLEPIFDREESDFV